MFSRIVVMSLVNVNIARGPGRVLKKIGIEGGGVKS
jgi:hypothetical protein